MILKVLSENTTSSEKFGSEHGLSLYIETETHKILFDVGASGLFAENAEKMGVDLTKIDLAVISHGHYDHGGGMGGGAIDIFNERNVEVVVGASGDAKTAVLNYLKGELKSTGSVCHKHQHHDECGD